MLLQVLVRKNNVEQNIPILRDLSRGLVTFEASERCSRNLAGSTRVPRFEQHGLA
jgi:hypothetical protein